MQRLGTSMNAIAIALVLGRVAMGCQTPPPEPPPPPAEEEFQEEVVVVEIVEEVVPELRTIYFDFNKADIRSDARGVLKSNAEIIIANRQLGAIALQGNTD